MSRPFFVLLVNEKIVAAPRPRLRDVCTHQALRLTSYINVNAPLVPTNNTDEVRKRERKEKKSSRTRESGGGITNSWICLSGEDGHKKKKKRKRKNRTLQWSEDRWTD